MPQEGLVRGVNRGIHGRPGSRHGDRRGPQAESLAQGDDIVEGHVPLSVAGSELLGKLAQDGRVGARDGGRKAAGEGLGVGEELPEGEVAVARPEFGILIDRALERSRGEPGGSGANGRCVGREAGGQVSRGQAERWVAHEREV